MTATTCAFTGHRPHRFPWKNNEDDPRCVSLKKALAKEISGLVYIGVTDFYSGGAEGVDCWAAQIVLELREKNPALKLHCILPYEGQADKWSDSARERYQEILKNADSVKYVSRDYYDGCLIERNHWLVDSADYLLAVFKGAKRSGTGATVNYARKQGKTVCILDPITWFASCEGIQN